jgi:hypothetical protein
VQTFLYKRHVGALLVAVLLLFFFSRWDLFEEPYLPTFALSGALHAGALCVALRAPESAVRKCLFIAIAASLSVLTLYIGILSLQLFAVLPAAERLYLALGTCSMTGAITYGLLVRFFWMKKLSSRSILAIAVGCAAAACLAFLAKSHFEFLDSWVMAAAWWGAFSGGLAYFDRVAKPMQQRR